MPVQIGQKPDHSFEEPLGLLSDCHRRIEHFLEVLVRVSQLRGGDLDAESRPALDGALRYFREAAPRHTADEEVSLFPRLRECGSEAARRALAEVARLENDHRAVEPLHAEVDDLGRRWLSSGTLDPASADRFGEIIAQLSRLYAAHIEVEDSTVFPLAKQALTESALAEAGREMRARRKA